MEIPQDDVSMAPDAKTPKRSFMIHGVTYSILKLTSNGKTFNMKVFHLSFLDHFDMRSYVICGIQHEKTDCFHYNVIQTVFSFLGL